ncbi:MAG: hypothetical protein JMN24_08145 [gamma proteobacterium endosymbiont of Lamellibrachia anaximandri]|nr:hypothetical protein [gamma proteobacterium endosymbiont of Lamellibrachia anaximandri]MBL3618830.1 hypothetical protein [gamma proteobacterium endosymbiont of Lamellibrachia anaximandri]
MWHSRILSRHCCGGPVLAMTLLFAGLGFLFLLLSAYVPGLVFIAVGVLSEGLCFILSRTRCRQSYTGQLRTR